MKEKALARKEELTAGIQQQTTYVQQLKNALTAATNELIAMQGALQVVTELIEGDEKVVSPKLKPVKTKENE